MASRERTISNETQSATFYARLSDCARHTTQCLIDNGGREVSWVDKFHFEMWVRFRNWNPKMMRTFPFFPRIKSQFQCFSWLAIVSLYMKSFHRRCSHFQNKTMRTLNFVFLNEIRRRWRHERGTSSSRSRLKQRQIFVFFSSFSILIVARCRNYEKCSRACWRV